MASKPPPIDPRLVDWLASVFPDKCPNETDTDRAIWIGVGTQRVIKKLRAEASSQSGTLFNEET